MIKKTTLLHVPASTMLTQNNADGDVVRYRKLPEPATVLAVHGDTDYFGNKIDSATRRIFWDDQFWIIRSNDAFEIEKEKI